MAREKKEKISHKGVSVDLVDNKVVLTSQETGEVVEEDFIDKLFYLYRLYGSLAIEVKDFKTRLVNRKPIYKYICQSCHKEVKSDVEDLHATCKDCNCEFVEKL